MAVLAPPVQVVTANAPPFVHVASGAPPFVVTTGPAPPIQIVASGAPPITLFNEDGSVWSSVVPGGGALLVGEANGFAADFTHPVDAERVALKSSGSTLAYAVDSFFTQGGTSPKMVYDVAGTLGWSPHNTCLQSQTFDNATWAKQNGTVSANAVAAPDGSMTADAWIPSVGNVDCHISQVAITPASAGVVYTASVYVKNGTLGNNWIELLASTDGVFFNIATGVLTPEGAVTAYTSTDVGNGWYRLTVTWTETTGRNLYIAARPNASQSAVVGNGTSPAFYLWGAQVNKGSAPTAYLPTTTAARIGLALDYDPVTHAAKGLLCEPQATNLVVESAMGRPGFLAGGNGSTRTTSAQTDPAGGSQALQVVITNALASTNVFKQYDLASVAATYTGSMWIKGTASQQVYLLFGDVPGQQLVTFTGSWQRVSMTTVAGATTLYLGFETLGRSNPNLPAVTFHVWGAQLELGTVATSYIPTLAATVTRAADQVKVTPASINYSATAGSWWMDLTLYAGSLDSRPISYVSGPQVFWAATATSFANYDGTAYLSKTVASILGSHKLACAFASADKAFTVDGLAVATDTQPGTALLSPGASIDIGFATGFGLQINGYIRKLRYLPRRPTNAELQTMTT